jgi:flagellar motor switch protein FliM
MSQVLTQSEVDALLSAVAEGEVDTTPEAGGAGDNSGVIVYDLTSQDRIIRGRMPTLDIVYERFIRNFRVSISNMLRKMATINVSSTDLLKFGEFMNTLPMPSCMNVIRFETLNGSAIIVVESKLCYALIDSFLGGTDRPFTKIEGKEFTEIELSIIKRVILSAIKDLEEAWGPVYPITISFQRAETNPQFVGIVPPTDVIIATTFEVELENANGVITLVIPYSTIEPIKNILSTGFQHERQVSDNTLWTSRMIRHVEDTFVNCHVTLGETEVNVGDVLAMKVGDVIPLNQDASGEIDVTIESTVKYRGLYGASRGQRAIQITQVVENKNLEFIKETKDDILRKKLRKRED